MKRAMLPLNLSLLVPTPEQLKTIRPVTSLDILDGPGGNFHDDGLFSTLTFGRVGDPIRDQRFGYIDLKLPIFHPVIYTNLIRLKGLYRDILAGTGYATWNPTTKDFERATELDGETGYHFFVSHWSELDPPRTGSSVRDTRIALITKYRQQALLRHLLVMPAGLRDAEVDSDGRLNMGDKINEIYQSVLMLTRNIPSMGNKQTDLSLHDRVRHTLTLRVVEIYQHIENLLSGKKGFIQSRWASRRVFNGTRNVLSSLDNSVADLDAPNRPKFNDTAVGVHQAARALLPKTLHALKTGLVGEVFNTSANTVELVHPDTLQRTWVEVSNDDLNTWSTDEGLERVVNQLRVVEQRDRPVMIAGHYLGLVYVDDQANFKILRSIDEVPETHDRRWVRPITYIELVYLSGLYMWNTNNAFVTRYPVENMMSSYPTRLYIKTTVVGELRYELGDDWQRKGDDYVALEYPRLRGDGKTQYHDSISVNSSRLKALGGDY